MINWLKRNKNLIIQNSFLLPILLVVIMSISHVVSWYDLGNPLSWAIYLSIAIEIFALASVSAATIKMNRASIWFLFGLVTCIQIIGNIFFEYKDINVKGQDFLSWVELIKPFFEDWDNTDHRRLLAIIQGGTLPMMSLTALHYYIKFTDQILESREDSTDDNELDEYFEEIPETRPPDDSLDLIIEEDESEKNSQPEPIFKAGKVNPKFARFKNNK